MSDHSVYVCQVYLTCIRTECDPKLLRWDLLIYIHYKIVRFVAVCQFVPSICVSGEPDTHTDGMWCQVTKMGSVDLHSL